MKKLCFVLFINLVSWFYILNIQHDTWYCLLMTALSYFVISHTILLLPLIIPWCCIVKDHENNL